MPEGSSGTGQNVTVTPNAIIVSRGEGSLSVLNVSRRISSFRQTDKALFELDYEGTRCIVKCWGPRHDRA